MAVAPFRFGQVLGLLISPVAAATNSLNATATWFAVQFVPDSARTLSEVSAYVSAVGGTPGAGKYTCDLYDSTGANGAPGASIETGKLPTTDPPVAGAWARFTGFSTALTSGQAYWAVFKNGEAVPATNFITFRRIAVAASLPHMTGGNTSTTGLGRFSWQAANSTNSGSTWASAGGGNIRIGYADGSYDGMPISNLVAAVVGDGVYSARESGVKFTSPLNASLRVAGLAMFWGGKSGSPTGNPRLGLWLGTTPVNIAYTTQLPSTLPNSANMLYAYFSAVQTIPAGSIVRVTLGETTQSDAGANRYVLEEFSMDTDANSTILLPWNGTCTKTYFDGTSTWTDATLGTSLFPHALLLDTSQEFNPSNTYVIAPTTNIFIGSEGDF